MKYFLLLFLIIISLRVSAQKENLPKCYYDLRKDPTSISIGSRKIGLGLGSFGDYNGLTLSVVDNTCYLKGVNFSVIGNINPLKHSIGLELGIFPFISRMDGVATGLIFGSVDGKLNGIGIFGVFGDTWHVNGVSISALAQLNDQVNGFSFGGVGLISRKINGVGITPLIQRVDSVANGLVIAGVSYTSEETNGVSIAPFNMNEIRGNGLQIGVFNMSGQFNGVQLGVLNVIQENPPWLRVLPIMNLNFKKDDDLMHVSEEVTLTGDTIKVVKTYYPTKKLRSKKSFRNGITHGSYLELHPNGKVSESGAYYNGRLHGVVVSLYSNGVVMSTVNYEYGRVTEGYYIYNRRGKIIHYVSIE